MFFRWPRQVLLLILLPCLSLSAVRLRAADSPWETARVVDVRTSVNTRSPSWIVNTPKQQEDETVCAIRVHLRDKIIQGIYTLDQSQPAPPQEWVKGMTLRVQITGSHLLLKTPSGDTLKLHLVSTKPAPMMAPLTPQELAAEKKAVTEEHMSTKSMIGFDERTDAPAKESEPVAQAPSPPPTAEAPTGTVSISSTPYLAEVFVDGESVGYTPAKLKVPPGKHSFRCEKQGYKPWTKDIAVTAGSELTLDATLPPGHK